MFDILLYLYDNYLVTDQTPDNDLLSSKLSAVGFDAADIDLALNWLKAMNQLSDTEPYPDSQSMRCYTPYEQQRLAVEGIDFLYFLETSGLLPAHAREWIIDRVLTLEDAEVPAEKIKWISLLAINRLHGPGDALWLEDLVRGDDDDYQPTLH